jgi:two-component system chemotaxis response regulator CheY
MQKKVLIVDDSSTTRRIISTAIKSLKFYYEEAKDGFEALQKLPLKDFDLIIVDINMPNINGLELIQYCKNSDLYKNIPIIIISTEDSEEDKKRGLNLGANAYLMKPVQPARIAEVVEKVLNAG